MLVSDSASELSQKFERDGYVVLDLNVPDFVEVSERIVATLNPVFDDTHRIENAWRSSKDVRFLATLPQVLDALRELYGRSAFPFQTLNFNRGTQQATHSDTIHFDSAPAGFMAGVWIALEDIDDKNGPLRYYPGSHTLPQKTLKDFGISELNDQDPYRLYRSVYEPGIDKLVKDHDLQPFEAHLRRGQALIWSANLLHGGQPILDVRRTRHSQVTHYYFEGCAYHTPLLSDEVRGIHRRYPVDIRTGRNTGGEIQGKPIRVPVASRMKSLTKTVLRAGTKHQR